MTALTLDGIELLDAIDRAGSFAGAAQMLGKVTSTVSYSINKFENDLGLKLFNRNGPNIELTAAGQDLLVEGRHLLISANDLECRVKRVANGWESELRIDVDSLIPTLMLSGLIQSFYSQGNGTRIKLMSEALTGTWEALRDGRADLIIAAGSGPSGGGYHAQKLTELEFVFCVSVQHPLADASEPIPASELKRHRAIVVSDSARRMPTRTIGLLRGQELVAVPDMRTKYAFQVAGIGIGTLPLLFAQSAIDRGLLVRKAVEEGEYVDPISIAWRSGENGKALQWWRDALSQTGVIQGYFERVSRAWVADH